MQSVSTSRWYGAAALCLLALALPAAGQHPEAECEPPAVAPAPDDPSVLSYCADNPAADCDLEIVSWTLPMTERSPDLRIGDPFNTMVPTPEQPRVFLDTNGTAATGDDRLYTKLYVKFRNAGGGAGGGGFAAAGDVTVRFDFKEAASLAAAQAAAADPTGWTAAGTLVMAATIDNDYLMDLPSPGVLAPSQVHVQQSGVCWTLAAGDPDFPKRFVLRATVDWPSDEDDGNDIAFSFYDLTAAGRRAQIGFAIDLSGSMGLAFDGSTRLAVAQDKAKMFVDLIEAGDQIGVFGFATGNPSNSPFTTSYNAPATPATAFGDTSQISPMQTLALPFQKPFIRAAIDAQSDHGCTPLGQGLLRAREAILSTAPPAGPPAPGKAIVVFSDGVQNVRPFVHAAPAYDCSGGVASPVIDLSETFTDQGIEIYSIHFGPEVGWAYALMNELKNQTGGDYVYGADDELPLAVAYFSIRGLVDDMVFLREDGQVSAGEGGGETFEVEFDAAAQTATAAVAWPRGGGGTRLTLDRRRQGDAEWTPCRPDEAVDDGDEFRRSLPNAGAPSSYLVCRFTPGADSTWQFRVRQAVPRQGSTRYTAAVFSLVQTAEIHPSLDDDDFTAGDPLTLHAALRSAGQPLTGASVTARVDVPRTSFGTVLHRNKDRLDAPPSSGDSSRVTAYARQLGDLLAADGGVYPHRGVAVTLTDDGQGADRVAGDGRYTGVLPGAETQVAGHYDVTFTATATLAGGRRVERIARLSTIADVATPDRERSQVTAVLSPDRVDGARVATVTVVPFDRFGNAAFPGSGHRIAFRTDGATARGGLVDLDDASYTQSFRLDRDDATVAVLFDDQPVAAAVPLAGGAAPRPGAGAGRELSLHAGVAVPHGTFGNLYSNGGSVAVDLAWRFGGALALKLEAAYDAFDASAVDDAELGSLSAYLQHRWAATGWQPYFEAGVGGYELDGSTAFGTAVGLGARWRLAPPWSLDLNVQHHWVGGGLGFDFSRVRAGVIYDF